MRAHHTHRHHHHHAHLYNIDPDAGYLIPPQPPRPEHQPAPSVAPEPRAEPARMAAAPVMGQQNVAPAPQAQGPQGEPARREEGARPWDRDWDAVLDPLGSEALFLVVEVYWGLSWAGSGTTREMRNQPFDAVLLRRDRGNQKVPLGGWAVPEDHERVLRALIGAGWPDREPTWPAFLEGGGRCSASPMRRSPTGSPGPCAPPSPTGATAGGTHHRRSPSHPASGDAGDGRPPLTQARGARGWGRTSAAGHPPDRAGPPDPWRTPHPPHPKAWRAPQPANR